MELPRRVPRGSETCWEGPLSVADGGAQVSGRGLREGKPGVAAGHRGRQPMYRCEMEADEAAHVLGATPPFFAAACAGKWISQK